MRQELEEDWEPWIGNTRTVQLAADLAKIPYTRELHDMKSRYDGNLQAHSHGESFLSTVPVAVRPQRPVSIG